MSTQDSDRFDVAIIGSGIAGSALAAILARHGLRVVVFEAKNHPRFSIGESLILETSEIFRALAELYDVPELAYFSSENYFSHIGTSHGVKRHFCFLYHTEHRPHNTVESLQAVIPREPHGHELHLYRQDIDYFLMIVAVHYGACVLQNTKVQDFHIAGDGVTVTTDQGQSFQANYIVDAGGFRSLLADRFGLRHTNLLTHSRALFTHMVDVPCYNRVGPSRKEYGMPFRISEGTLHHLFKGGWLWAIPFGNHPQSINPLCSVGLMLDPRVYPLRPEVPPEEEFFAFITRLPGIAVQFRQAKAVRAWTRTGRIQYGATRVVGDRFALLGHAAGFIDPLFSKGLYVSLMCVSVLANLLLRARQTGDHSAEAFQPLEDITQAFITTNDRLIAHAYQSFADYRLWAIYAVLWLLGAHMELLKLFNARARAKAGADYYAETAGLKLVGGGFPAFETLSEKIYALVASVNPDDDAAVVRTASAMRAQLSTVDWMPYEFRQVLHGRNTLNARKLRLDIFRQEGGPLGKGDYRKHFFGTQAPFRRVFRFLLGEKLKYATPTLTLKRRLQVWQAHRRLPPDILGR